MTNLDQSATNQTRYTVALTSLLGCAWTATHRGMGKYLDDAIITSKVKTAICNEPSLNSAEINFATFTGEAQLSGLVISRTNKIKAVEVTRSVGRVKSVMDDMQLKWPQ